MHEKTPREVTRSQSSLPIVLYATDTGLRQLCWRKPQPLRIPGKATTLQPYCRLHIALHCTTLPSLFLKNTLRSYVPASRQGSAQDDEESLNAVVVHCACVDSPELVEHLRQSHDLFAFMLQGPCIFETSGKTNDSRSSHIDAMRLCTVRMLLYAHTDEATPAETARWRSNGEDALAAEVPARRRHLARYVTETYDYSVAAQLHADGTDVRDQPHHVPDTNSDHEKMTVLPMESAQMS